MVVEATTADKRRPVVAETIALPKNLVAVPLVQQRSDFSCGAAATLALLRYWCVQPYWDIEESELHGPLRTSSAHGTEPEPMAELLRGAGLEACYRHGAVAVAELEGAVDRGEPPIVGLQAWSDHLAAWRDTWDAGHYVVVVGYDERHLFFADPSRATPAGYAFVPRSELEDRWHDLAGVEGERVERMTIFVRGERRWAPSGPIPASATRLG